MPDPWWKSSVFYQVYVRSFADSNDDGIGDLDGLRQRLDHLKWLGVDAVLLSPFHPSPLVDFGYDITDHRAVDPGLGSLESFERLVAEAHLRGLRILIDFVANHTSDQHPWFRASRSSRADPKREWYLWRDPHPDGSPPNNWVGAFAVDWRWEPDPQRGDLRMIHITPSEPRPLGSAWTLDPPSGQCYLHLFLAEEPDVNWSDPALAEAMVGVARYWLNLGVDGMRVDAVQALGKDPSLSDDTADSVGVPRSSTNDDPHTHEIVRVLRGLLDEYEREPVGVGEVYLMDTARVASYCGPDELHLAFDPVPLHTRWEAAAWRQTMRGVESAFGSAGWPTWVLSNHDTPRARTRLGSEPRARAAAVILLASRGTPFLYYGEELGLGDADLSPARVQDPAGRDAYRAPMPWDAHRNHGWPTTPWTPWSPDPDVRNVASQRDDPGSMLALYRRLIRIRRESPALSSGISELLESARGTLCWARTSGEDRRLVAINFEPDPMRLFDHGVEHRSWAIELSTVDDHERWDGLLGAEEAVILRPA